MVLIDLHFCSSMLMEDYNIPWSHFHPQSKLEWLVCGWKTMMNFMDDLGLKPEPSSVGGMSVVPALVSQTVRHIHHGQYWLTTCTDPATGWNALKRQCGIIRWSLALCQFWAGWEGFTGHGRDGAKVGPALILAGGSYPPYWAVWPDMEALASVPAK